MARTSQSAALVCVCVCDGQVMLLLSATCCHKSLASLYNYVLIASVLCPIQAVDSETNWTAVRLSILHWQIVVRAMCAH